MSSIVFGVLLIIGGGVFFYVAFRLRGGDRARRRRAAAVGGVGLLVLVLGLWVALGRASVPPAEEHASGTPAARPASAPAPTEVAHMPAGAPVAPAISSTTPVAEGDFPSYPTIMHQHLNALRRDLERARDAAKQERQKSDALSRQLDALQAQIKALAKEIDRQDRQTHQLRQRLKGHQEDARPPQVRP